MKLPWTTAAPEEVSPNWTSETMFESLSTVPHSVQTRLSASSVILSPVAPHDGLGQVREFAPLRERGVLTFLRRLRGFGLRMVAIPSVFGEKAQGSLG